MEHDEPHIEYNDVSLLASGASKHACMRISDGCSSHNRNSILGGSLEW